MSFDTHQQAEQWASQQGSMEPQSVVIAGEPCTLHYVEHDIGWMAGPREGAR